MEDETKAVRRRRRRQKTADGPCGVQVDVWLCVKNDHIALRAKRCSHAFHLKEEATAGAAAKE